MGCREHTRATAGTLCCAVLLQVTLWMIPAAHAQTYRWIDERGRVHYSDIKPPQAREQAVLDKQGRVLRQPQQPDVQTRKGMEDGAKVREAARERQDRALLSTYVHEGEIDLARDRALTQERAKRESLQAMLQQVRGRLAQIQAAAAAHTQAGRPVPEALRQSRDETQRELAHLNEMLGRNAEAMARTQARYEGYKQRFRELKALAGQAPSSVSAAPAEGNAVR